MRLNKFLLYILLPGFLIVGGCSTDDPDTTEEKETPVVVQKVSSINVEPGKNRVKVTWTIPENSGIKKVRVYWNGEQDWMEVPVTAGTVNMETVINDLDEGNYSFSVYAYDKDDNSSAKVFTNGRAYGSEYESSLINRPIQDVVFNEVNSDVIINWDNAENGTVGLEIEYIDADEVEQIVEIDPFAATTTLNKFVAGEEFAYRTLYKPTPTAIDTFYTEYETIEVQNLYIVDEEDDETPPSIYYSNPETGASNNFGLIGNGNVEPPSSITAVNDPVRGLIWRFQKPVGSNRCENHGIKVNGSKYEFKNNTTYYFGWWSKLTNNSNNNANFQWKSYGDHSQNFPLVLKMRDGNMILQQRQPDGVETIIWTAPWEADTWYKLALGIHVSDELRGGWVELWFNGVKQTFSDGSQRYYCRTFDGGHNCPKWGIYGRNDLNISNYIDRLKIGTSYEEVD